MNKLNTPSIFHAFEANNIETNARFSNGNKYLCMKLSN